MALVPFPGGTPAEAGPPAPEEPRPDDIDDLAAEGEDKMSFLEHLDELRKRILRSLLALLIGFLVAFAFIRYIFEFIMRPLQEVLPDSGRLIYTEPTEAFILYIKIAALAGLILAAPAIIWQFWLFISPGLYTHEKRFAIPFVVLTTIGFVGGALFAHYVVFPVAWGFFASFSTDYMQFMPRIAPVFSLYVRIVLALGVIFQMPTLVFFLARMGVVTHGMLIRHFKYAVFVAFVLAAVLTPPDGVTQALVAAPIVALYGLGIGIAWLVAPRKAQT